jgi:NAD(P)H-hydrate epimerase
VGAHLTTLRREAIGGLRVENAVPPDRVTAEYLMPPARVLGHLPAVELDPAARAAVVHGRPVSAAGVGEHRAGAVALLAGSAGMTGAALLAARGAVRMGAGYASMGTTAATEAAKAAVLPEVLSAVVSDGEVLGPEALERFAGVLDAAGALGIGPGLGRGDAQRDLVNAALGEVKQPVVADADALNVLAGDAGALTGRSGATVITPHPGELARLLQTSIGDVQADRLSSARRAAQSFNCVVLLKGHRTVVAEPRGRAVVNPTGTPHLATAGTGDVLTGAIAALLAAGVPAFDAAWAAAFVHGVAGRLAAERLGPGVLAWDVAESLSPARATVAT